MKKIYIEVELEDISLTTEDVIAISDYNYDPDGNLNNNKKKDDWEW